MQRKVLVGLSGGLDSSYTAYLLRQEGYEVSGIHFSNGYVSDSSIATIKKIADFLGISVSFVDIHEQFQNLLHNVDIEMCHGLTPNICVKCARDIKFGYIMDYALSHGYDFLATGHYVQIIHDGTDTIVKKGIDKTRDQSYGFGAIPKDHLVKALTPLGSLIKVNIRSHATEIGLPFIHKESADLCFTSEPLKIFYPKITQVGLVKGNLISDRGNVPHEGQQLYTRGQKVSVSGHRYIVDKKLPNGDIIVSQRTDVTENIIKINNVNLMIDIDNIDITKIYQFMIRYKCTPINCRIIELTTANVTVKTEEPMYAPTDGQIGTIYDGDRIVLGGFIYHDM